MLLFILLALISSVSCTPMEICGQTFEVISGSTRTINYYFEDGSYPGNADCVFKLTGEGGDGLTITFLRMNIEKHTQCNFDYLKIYDGTTTNSRLLRTICGTEIPQQISTATNTATLKFVSDRTVHKRGFVLQFATKSSNQYQGTCVPPLTTTTGVITSPEYPSNYPNKVNCTYEIAPPSGNHILVSFPLFQLERSSNCVMDYVTINTRTEQIGSKLCGDLPGYSFIIPGSHATIRFVSDRSSTRKGFELSYKVIRNCNDLQSVCKDGCEVGEDGSLDCRCRAGYISGKGEAQCKDINECQSGNGGCAEKCHNTIGSFECSCPQDGFFLAPDGRNCTDRTCAVSNAGCEHNCHLSGDGGYFCTCNKGFLIDQNGHNCSDINECTNTKYIHSCDQKCENEAGSYYCDCEAGYVLSHNGRTCNDVDECITEGMNCEHQCHNYPGGWSCACYPGYEVNPSDRAGCIDIDECSSDLLPEHCDECHNFDGWFSCTACSPGFRPNENQTLCDDINECELKNGGCQQDCINLPGSFRCSCRSGNRLTGVEGSGECEDINECAPNNGRGPCDHYCENSQGSFQCHCLEGYNIQAGNGITCEDIDECFSDNGGCSQQCTNRPGSFDCSCFPGYWRIEGRCQDVDECLEDKPCDVELGAVCTNTEGSFQCTCPSGYNIVNTTICQDIDECANTTFGANHGCPQKCVNTAGGYHCACHAGFIDVGNNTCTDLNECSQSICMFTCENTIGSFICSCPPGYYLLADQHTCSDVDECAADSVHCDHICLNKVGTFSCACRDGYELETNGYLCTDIDECHTNVSECSDGCVNINGGYYCYCYQGYDFAGDANNKTCTDIDECATDNGGCQHVCTNTPGSFRCGCRDGYTASEHMCHDINECSVNNGGCDQSCLNYNGTYACECAPDFKLAADNHTCGHCPSCEMFSQVVSDVAILIPHTEMLQQLRQNNMQLNAAVAMLRAEVDELKRQSKP